MEHSEILYDVEGSAALVTLNRPARLNARTGTMETELRDVLRHAERDRDVRGIILTSARGSTLSSRSAHPTSGRWMRSSG